jgi:hypothetical protein
MAKYRGDGREPSQRAQRCRGDSVVLSPRRVRRIVRSIALNNTRRPTAPAWGSCYTIQGGHQGKLGYENRPTYDYLARSQARNWPYPASQRGRALGVRQDTLGLALALRSRSVRDEGVGILLL